MKQTCKMLALVLVMATLAACGGQYRNHGYMPLAEDVDALIVGVDTRDSIIEVMGVPTTGGVLTEEAMYYVRSRVHHKGYVKPNEIQRDVLVLSFDKNQILRNVERFGIEKGKLIRLEHRVTEAPGGDRSVLQQIIGSIGGFNPNSIVNN
ncbi:MAG: outer membrane protein assembly factor BamE [Paracoccaceae bacterium]|jgi:outer membrane protein assembly factor BamE (lipoprotein component of BamABCDE complex)|nr:outer membrane protein assembly factor BamE [Paracoccaceae bacterium]NCW53210.1 outer membrane protein assembly factor BamE [Paracoccaceae bacterium]